MHDALEVAQSGCEHHPRDAEGWCLLGRISHHAGLRHASDIAFRRAALLSDRPPPPRLDAGTFRALVDEAGAGVTVRPLPDAAAIANGVAPDALSSTAPDGTRTLYQVNVENRCRDEAEVADLIALTLVAAT